MPSTVKPRSLKFRQLGMAMILAAGLAACGGSDDDSMQAGNGGSGGNASAFPPVSASSSNQGFVSFIQSLISGNNATDLPALLNGGNLTGDEVSEPLDV